MNTLIPTNCNSTNWINLRNKFLESLREAMTRHLIDEDIVDILVLLNSIPCIVTSSSCSGRIALFAANAPGDKKRGGIVAKWHKPITVDEFLQVLRRAGLDNYRFVWVSAQPLILALYTCSLSIANELLRMAERLGLKYSGMKIREKSIYIMILGTERVDIPLRVDNNVFIDLNDIKEISSIVDILNTYLVLAKRKLARLKRGLATSLTLVRKECEEATLH